MRFATRIVPTIVSVLSVFHADPMKKPLPPASSVFIVLRETRGNPKRFTPGSELALLADPTWQRLSVSSI
jgi:hypothetical protein